MSWFNLQIGKHKAKYVALNPQEQEYPSCNENGEPLRKVAGKFEKGYFEDEKGNRYDKAFKLINGKASSGFVGRVKEVENPIYVEQEEVGDILKTDSKEFLVECETLYDELTEKKKAVKFGGWFGNGYSGYRVYVYPSPLYKGFCEMVATKGQKSEVIKGVVGELEATKELQKKLAQVELTIQKVNRAKVEDLIKI